MSKIDTLSDEYLSTWRQIRRQIWLFENVDLGSELVPARAMGIYDEQVEFIRGCIEEYDIDETKPFKISEHTGLIYYLEG